jgi:hypothetical protein
VSAPHYEITVFRKVNGPLTKRISLQPDGAIKSDGSACIMARGQAERLRFEALRQFADAIARLGSGEAIALGALRDGLPEQVEITTRGKLAAVNGAAPSGLIARTQSYIQYRPGAAALALIDHDRKGMPADLAARLADPGAFWRALVGVCPALRECGHVWRASTSSGLRRADTGAEIAGSGGLHIYVPIRDGSDAERFLKALHQRCWLAGYGWLMVGAAGQILERSIVDRTVGSPERLVFEGAPILEPPLVQDARGRQPVTHEGPPLDTVTACPPLTIAERSRLDEMLARAAAALEPDAARARDAYVRRHAEDIAARTGIDRAAAERIVRRQCGGILRPEVILHFDDPDISKRSVAEVLADPERYEGETLADPLEGPQYGVCKARVMRRADGTLWIHSCAHGLSTRFELRHDYASLRRVLEALPESELVRALSEMAPDADLDAVEAERLRDYVAQRAGAGKRTIDRAVDAARAERRRKRAEEDRRRRLAERRDPRPRLPAPAPDGEFLPVMAVLNEILGQCRDPVPPFRDGDRDCAAVRLVSVPSLSLLARERAREQGQDRLPAPRQLLVAKLTEEEISELIERHIEYVNEREQPVRLQSAFVRHFARRHDGALPIATTVAQMPIVLPDGTLLAGPGLHRDSGVIFEIPLEMLAVLPDAKDCDDGAIAQAMKYLCDDWLVDVATDLAGKCVLLACALSVIERALLPERPAFFITAGQRGGGKTTAIHMISTAALGVPACAAAWSNDDEERRKALLAYFSAGLPMLTWDNITRGAAISCPHIEKALTNEFYSDRVLGFTQYRLVLSSTIHVFTGNNIAPRGDMASRSLSARLAVDRPDPENRPFVHSDPLGWTQAHRARILRALYTILVGNPRRRPGAHPAPETRFKAWWDLVGSAVEHAARLYAAARDVPAPPPFREMFLAGEADEEQTSSLITVIETIRRRWPLGAKAFDVAQFAAESGESGTSFRAALELATGKGLPVVTATAVTWRLKSLVDAPVRVRSASDGDAIMVLRYLSDKTKHGGFFRVEVAADAQPAQSAHPSGRIQRGRDLI